MAVAGPADRTENPGATFTATWTVANRSNAARRFTVTPWLGSSSELVVESASDTGTVTIPEGGRLAVSVSYRLRSDAVVGTGNTASLPVADADAPELAATGSFTATTALVLAAPTVASPGDRSAGAVERFVVSWTVRNAADQDGTIVSYEWFTVSPAGVWAYLGSAANPATSFPKAGGWRFWVRVTDNNGGQASGYTDPVAVLNRAPAASPTAAPSGEYTFVPVRLEANASDADGTVTGYAWYTIDPGGAWAYVGGGASASFTPGRPGTWYTYVMATDDDGGQVGAYTAAISVRNRALTAAPGFSPDGQPSRLLVQLYANAADPDGSVTGYAWYVIDPGGGWTYVGGRANAGFTPSRGGTWYGYVVATDDLGAQTAAYTGPITVAQVYGCTDPGARNYNPGATANDGSCVYNQAPVAVLDVGYPGGQSFAWEGEAVSLDLRRSWDPDGNPLTGNLGSGLTGSASWGAEGTYYVTGTVSADHGERDQGGDREEEDHRLHGPGGLEL